MLSLSCKYAIRAVTYITANSSVNKRLGIKEIANEIEANEHTTAKILQNLARQGIISSVKGPNGGFYMDENAPDIYLIDIVKVIDGTSLFTECGMGLKQCSENHPCPIHHNYKIARELLLRDFSSQSIRELARTLAAGKAYIRAEEQRK